MRRPTRTLRRSLLASPSKQAHYLPSILGSLEDAGALDAGPDVPAWQQRMLLMRPALHQLFLMLDELVNHPSSLRALVRLRSLTPRQRSKDALRSIEPAPELLPTSPVASDLIRRSTMASLRAHSALSSTVGGNSLHSTPAVSGIGVAPGLGADPLGGGALMEDRKSVV